MDARHSLTPTQQGMLFHHVTYPGSGVDIEQIVCKLNESIDPRRLHKCWQSVLDRHGALRSRFDWEGVDDPVRDVSDDCLLPLQLEDWRDQSETVRVERLDALLKAERAKGFDLREAPCMRLVMAQVGDERWEVLWTFHHLVCDGRSFPIVLHDVFSAYDSGASPESYSGPDFSDHVAHIANLPEETESFWHKRLEGFTEPNLLPGPIDVDVVDREII